MLAAARRCYGPAAVPALQKPRRCSAAARWASFASPTRRRMARPRPGAPWSLPTCLGRRGGARLRSPRRAASASWMDGEERPARTRMSRWALPPAASCGSQGSPGSRRAAHGEQHSVLAHIVACPCSSVSTSAMAAGSATWATASATRVSECVAAARVACSRTKLGTCGCRVAAAANLWRHVCRLAWHRLRPPQQLGRR